MEHTFRAANDEAKAVMDLAGIPWEEKWDEMNERTYISINFPDTVVWGNDGDEESCPSYYTYTVGKDVFVCPNDTEILVVE